jgi:CBS domain-containing protein
MKIGKVMTASPESVAPDDTLQVAAWKMRDLDVGPLPVCDGDRLIGILTDRDIAVRAVAEGRDPKATRVRDVMTEDLIYCFDDDQTRDAARIMQENQVRRLLVLNRDMRLVGIVALADLVTETGDTQRAGEVLEVVSEPGDVRG